MCAVAHPPASLLVVEIQRLLALTFAERDEERARRATDVVLVKRRTTRVWIAAGLAIWLASRIVTIRFGGQSSVAALRDRVEALERRG